LEAGKDYIGYCDACGKRRYGNRKSARVVARRMNEHLVAYRCPKYSEFWHVGHLAKPVIHGVAPKEVIYREVTA